MTFVEKAKASKNNLLYLVRGKDKGKACWHYVLVNSLKLPLFEMQLKIGRLMWQIMAKLLNPAGVKARRMTSAKESTANSPD